MRGAYYNENDPRAAAWLRQLITDGMLPEGEVDERDIRDVVPSELSGYRQCHFFAGIGGWPYALRLAGCPDDRPVWTGSCPCQPFSQAGGRAGFDDVRHLWPAWFHLIEQCRPEIIYGEQVASKAALEWIDAVFDDLEGTGYTCRAEDLCAAGVGAPHIRQRLFWMADAGCGRDEPKGSELGSSSRADQGTEDQRERFRHDARDDSDTGRLADADRGQRNGVSGRKRRERDREEAGRKQGNGSFAGCGEIGRMADADRGGSSPRSEAAAAVGHGHPAVSDGSPDRAGPLDGFWRDADWLGCRDGRWRPVEPGTFPLVDWASARMGRLRGYGNAIVPQVAAEFVMGSM